MGLFPDRPKGEPQALKEAIEASRKRLNENPADTGAVLKLADDLAGSGRKAEAVQLLNRHGPIVQSRGRLEEAVSIYRKVSQLDPNCTLSSSTFLSQLELKKILEAGKQDRAATPPASAPPPSGTFTSSGPESPPPASGSFARPAQSVAPPPSGSFARPAQSAALPPSGSFALPGPARPDDSGWNRKKEAVHSVRAGIPLLRDIPPDLIELVLEWIRLVPLAPGEVLFREGSEGSSVYFVVRGTLGLTSRNDLGTEVLLRTARDGDSIGEASFLTGLPHYATVTAWEPSNLLELDHNLLAPITRMHRPLADALNRVYEERVLGAALARSRVFGVLAETERRQLTRRLETLAVPAGTSVVRQGAPAKGSYIVKRGAFRVTFRSGEREVAVSLLRPHEAFGDLGEGPEEPQAESVTAVAESELLCLSSADLADFRSRNPPLAATLDTLRFDRAERCVAALRAARS